MRILYLAEDYLGSKVHYNLCNGLSVLGVDIVVATVHRPGSPDISETFPESGLKVLVNPGNFSPLLYKYDFAYKLRQKYGWLKRNVDLRSFDAVIAATMFSEGAVACKIFKDYRVPYIVCVRGTDVNFYLKYMFHLWPLGRLVLRNSSHIVAITERIRCSLAENHLTRGIVSAKSSETVSINNGIDRIWIERWRERPKSGFACRILYIGRFDGNKNVERLMDAVERLKPSFPTLTLSLVGGGGDRNSAVLRRCNDKPEMFRYLGKVYDKERLLEIIRSCDVFAMVSHSETFGLVYFEALSQGLPVLYTKGQGIDGVFKDKIGESCDSSSVDSIVDGLKHLMESYMEYDVPGQQKLSEFSWENVCRKYRSLLNGIK